MRATDQQVQNFADNRMRPNAERLRALLLRAKDDKAAIDDVYEHLTGANNTPSTWADDRMDSPPILLEGDDLLAYNAFLTDFISFCETHPSLARVLSACVQPLPL